MKFRKPLVSSEQTQQSLLRLRDDLIIQLSAGKEPPLVAVLLRINSCLFSEYPSKPRTSKQQDIHRLELEAAEKRLGWRP